MKTMCVELFWRTAGLWRALKDEKGQDLVEYAAVIVLVVLALTGGMTTLANAINNAMTNVGTLINSTIG